MKIRECFISASRLFPLVLIALTAAIVIGVALHSIDIAISPFCSFIEPILGLGIAGIMTAVSVFLAVLGLTNLLYWQKKDLPGIFSLIFGGLIAYFFIFHFWPKHLGH